MQIILFKRTIIDKTGLKQEVFENTYHCQKQLIL